MTHSEKDKSEACIGALKAVGSGKACHQEYRYNHARGTIAHSKDHRGLKWTSHFRKGDKVDAYPSTLKPGGQVVIHRNSAGEFTPHHLSKKSWQKLRGKLTSKKD